MLPGVTGSKKFAEQKQRANCGGTAPEPPEFSALEAAGEAGKEKAG